MSYPCNNLARIRNFLFLVPALVFNACSQPELRVQNLEVDFISNLGTDPVFSWQAEGSGNGKSQSAWQIIVSDNLEDTGRNQGNIWDSDKNEGSHVSGIQYAGEKLAGGRQYFARVRTWDENGNPSEWSETERFCKKTFSKT